MTEAEITSFILFGFGLTFHIVFRTLRPPPVRGQSISNVM